MQTASDPRGETIVPADIARQRERTICLYWTLVQYLVGSRQDSVCSIRGAAAATIRLFQAPKLTPQCSSPMSALSNKWTSF